jgi:hypothetical protein
MTTLVKLLNYTAILSPILVCLLIIALSIFYKSPYLILFILCVIASGYINLLLKWLTESLYASYKKEGKIISPEWGLRPDPCGKIQNDCVGCGLGIRTLIDKDSYQKRIKEKIEKNEWGFPSGHAQFAFLTSLFWSIYIVQKDKKTSGVLKPTSIILISILWICTLLVCYQRYHSKCHNKIQLFSGSLIGIGLGYFIYKWFQYFLPKYYY